MFALIRFLLIFLCSIPLWANMPSWYTIDAKKQVTLNVDLFLSSTCPHCHKADEFFKEIEPNNPWLHVQRHIINEDKEALTLFNQFLVQQNIRDFSVPSIFFCTSRWLGFASAETTGKDILKSMQYCKQQIEKKGRLTNATVNVIKRWANANMLNSSVTEQSTILHYLMTVVFLDIGNPCSVFCILSLFAFLMIQQNKATQFMIGCLFALAIVLVHSLQQMQTNLYYQILTWYRFIAILISLSGLYLVFQHYRKRVFKPYVLFIWVFFFAITIYAYQQNCVMNWAYVFQQWLNNQRLATGQQISLQIIYQIIYILPLFIMILVYLFLSKFNQFKVFNSLLEHISLVFLIITLGILLIQPKLLSLNLLSYLVFLISLISGVILNVFQKKKEKDR